MSFFIPRRIQLSICERNIMLPSERCLKVSHPQATYKSSPRLGTRRRDVLSKQLPYRNVSIEDNDTADHYKKRNSPPNQAIRKIEELPGKAAGVRRISVLGRDMDDNN